ncbi:hypothetical protein [Rhodococcus erythropolis]
MTQETSLSHLVEQRIGKVDTLDSQQLRDLWNDIIGEGRFQTNDPAGEFIEILQDQISGEGLDISLGTWRFKAKSGVVTTGLVSAIAATVLQSLGYDDILGYILPSILPIVLNIEEIELDERDSALILVLKEKRNDDGSLRSVDQIYKSLPRNEQRRLSKIDLVAFLERLRRTGDAEKVGDKYSIKPDGETRFLTIRWN